MNADDLLLDAEIASSHRLSVATHEAYENAFQQYQAIIPLVKNAPSSFPITSKTIIIFLAYKRKMDCSYNTIITLYRCLCGYCREHEIGNFSDDEAISKYLQGLNHDMLGNLCPHQVDGMTTEHLRRISTRMVPNRFYHIRDIAAF